MPRRQWTGTDPRDVAFDRQFSLFGLDELASIRGGHQSIVILLACPSGNREAVIVDRVHSLDARIDARVVVDVVRGGDGDDKDHGRNLRNRLALIHRDYGDCTLQLAVYYGSQLPARDHPPEKPTDAMVQRIRHELEHEGGMGGFHWKSARSLEELPTSHERALLAIVGLDSRGRIDDGLPRPSVHTLDRWMRRDLRQLAGAVMAHTMFAQTVAYCEQHGLTLLWLWRWERPQRA